jgi:hypothetical protein
MGYVGNQTSNSYSSMDKQTITGNGGASYTLTHAVANAQEIEVFVNNVRQEAGVAYTVAGTALSMTGNVASTDDFYVIYQGKALQTVVPPDGSVTSAKLDTNIDIAGILDVQGNIRTTHSSGNRINIAHDGVNGSISNEGGDFLLYANGSQAMVMHTNSTERMRIDSSGNLLVGATTFDLIGSNITGFTAAGAGEAQLSRDGGVALKLHRKTNTGGILEFFYNGATVVGSVSTNGSSVSYNTSSDYRLKENVTDITGATDRLKQLNPVRFNFIADADTTVDGFLAHEVQDVVPEAITGSKDAVDADGNPVYQGIDQSKLVPLLVATIQELEARIAALEAE